MTLRTSKTRRWVAVLLACVALVCMNLAVAALAAKPGGLLHRSDGSAANAPAAGTAQVGTPAPASDTTTRTPLKVAERSEAAMAAPPAPELAPAQANEHPLVPALKWARKGLANMEKLQDYSATLAKRERIGGKLLDYEYMFVKLRQKPFSVYMYFLGPPAVRGRECLYVQGQNSGKMWAHDVGLRSAFGTVSLKPDGPVAMQNERYPLTELGIMNMTRRLVEVAEKDINYGECEVKYFQDAKINGRICTCIEVIHPKPRRNFLFHIARIFVDKELDLPIRYESYDWPSNPGGKPDLMEEYTYLNLKLNNGYTDADFDVKNPAYKFH
jgi:hypothetical protein